MYTFISSGWNSYLDEFEETQKDIYYYEQYVKLYETDEGKAFCIICLEDDNILMMPFIRKEIEGYFDFETAYGYGGPIANTDDKNWIIRAVEAAGRHFKSEKYICGFIRFHSLLDNAGVCEKCFNTIFDRNTIMIQTDMSEDEIWSQQIISKNRNMIRKAEKSGLVYKAEYDFASIKDFARLYNATMKRIGADEFYFFDKKYYSNFIKNLKGHAFLGTIRKDEKLICAALFMYTNEFGHYHLEGSDHDFSNFGANNLLLWKTALEMQKLGVKQFHLGGGNSSAPDDPLLKFKKSFSKNTRDFYIGKWIFDDAVYDRIKAKWMTENPEKVEKYGKMLLCYRY